MAVIKMGLVAGQDLDFSKPYEATSTLQWLAVTDSNFDTCSDVYNYGLSNLILPLPYVGFHPTLTAHLCRNVKVKQQDGAPRHWTITAEYSSAPTKDEEQEENPLNRPPRVRWRTNHYRQAIYRDIDGKAILNKAGDYFDPPVEVDRSRWTVNVTANVADVPGFMLDYEDAVNNASITIGGVVIPQYAAKIMDLDIGELKREGDYLYYEFGYSLEIRRELWIPLKVLNAGLRYKSGEQQKQIFDNSSPARPVSSPRLLDDDGTVLSDPTPTRAKYCEFTVYYARPFSVLPGVS